MVLCVVSLSRLDYKEDMAEFLPIDRSTVVDRIYRSRIKTECHGDIPPDNFAGSSTDLDVTQAMDLFEELWFEYDTWTGARCRLWPMSRGVRTNRVRSEALRQLLTPDDYDRMDSLLAVPGFVE